MLSSLNQDMLVLARESRGISQYELANTIGVSQGKLSKAEKGEQSLSSEVLGKLFYHLNYPERFFYQETPSAPVSHYYYRKKVSIPKKTILQMEASIKIFRKNIDSLLDAVELPQFNFPIYDEFEDKPQEYAKKVRFYLGIEKGPIENLTDLLESNGITIIKTDLFNEKIDGLSTVSEKGNHIIFLNSRMPNDRQRFSLAHELGHLLMHFDLPSQSIDIEDEANKFASELLMPKAEIINSLKKLTFSKLGNLKRYWKVSMRSLVYRAHQLGAINYNEYRNFQINFSRKKMNKSEPIILQSESTFVLNEIIRLHLQELNYTKEELANTLCLNIEEFEERFLSQNRTKLKVIRN